MQTHLAPGRDGAAAARLRNLSPGGTTRRSLSIALLALAATRPQTLARGRSPAPATPRDGPPTIEPVPEPLPSTDPAQVAQFWSRFVASRGFSEPSNAVPDRVQPFGDSAELADELIELVVHGRKRATAAAAAEYELEGAPLPIPGRVWIATDGAGRGRAVLRTTEVRVGPLRSVDEAFASDEGEGERTREWWLAAHESFFRRYLPTVGVGFDPAMATVFERFEVLFAD